MKEKVVAALFEGNGEFWMTTILL